ncbi:hypothetical protein D1816_14295 [Aquimarina sp. AD10]|nr:hypothetical protein D1816_14295 [Aquimarina sp. AD10]
MDEAIENVILDFSSLNRVYKKDSIFKVTYTDTFYNMDIEKVKEGHYKSAKGEKTYLDYCLVSITANDHKMFFNSRSDNDIKYNLPSKYLEKDGKLFYWWDKNDSVTNETIKVLEKYGLLQNDDGWSKLPEMSTNDSKKGVDYFFCRNDLSEYKRVITSKSIEYYTPPKLDCN